MSFRWPVRVYYEDTDAAGVVYYANYLRFLERARTEWLASLGISLTGLEDEHGVVFVVHRLEIEYRRPARLYDPLEVTVQPIEIGKTRLVAAQDVLEPFLIQQGFLQRTSRGRVATVLSYRHFGLVPPASAGELFSGE